MRIAMLTNNYKPFIGGVPISIERLSEALRKMGHEVYIFAPEYHEAEEEPYVIRYRAFKKKLRGEMVIPHWFDRNVEEYFKVMKFDVIHVHHPAFSGWLGRYLGKKYDIPVAYTYHTRYEQYLHYLKPLAIWEEKYPQSSMIQSIKEKAFPMYVRQYTKGCDLVFSPTQLMTETLLEMGVTTPIKVLATGLNRESFKVDLAQATALREKYIGDKKYLFCSVSRISKEKNLMFMIEGLKRLREQMGNVFRCLLIGEGPDRQWLEKQVKRLGLEENIIFVGKLPNDQMRDYYGACDLFLFASKSETQGIVLLEAMAAHKPVVAIKASGVVEVVKDGYNGYMTAEDVNEWCQAISKVIADKRAYETLQEGAYHTAQLYGANAIATLAIGYYRQAIEGREARAVQSMEYEKEKGGIYYAS